MKFKNKLIEAVLIKRYKRFFADIEYKDPVYGRTVSLTVHVPNTGSLKSVIDPKTSQQKCWLSLNDDPLRKLKGTLEAVQTSEGVWVGVNTSYPNKIVQEAAVQSIQTKNFFLKPWSDFQFFKAEFKISKETRLDGVFCKNQFDLEDPLAKKYFIEIKNTTLMTEFKGQKRAQFPDAVTERGQKHLVELMNLVRQGHQAELIFTVQRNDVDSFSVADHIDPKYAELFKQAQEVGVRMTPLLVNINPNEIVLTQKILEIK